MSDLKRRPSNKKPPKYPSAREALKHRREFLALLAKGALGVGMLGMLGCDEDGKEYEIAGGLKAPDYDTVDVVDDVPVPGGIQAPEDTTDTWYDSGVGPMPDDTYDTYDTKDTNDTNDWSVAGDLGVDIKDNVDIEDIGTDFIPDGLPPMPDLVDEDSCTVQPDVGDDINIPLPGEAPMPDVIEPE